MTESLLSVADVEVTYRLPGPGRRARLRALDGVSMDLSPGETLGLVGESGSGKSTLARAVMGLVRPSRGTVTFDGADLGTLGAKRLRALRARMQMVFQDPYSSLDPSMRIGDIVAEPLVVHRRGGPKERADAVLDVLAQVGLDDSHVARFPRDLSGGQRQRVAIARALICDPDLLVCDEAVSALDVSVQSQVLNLLRTVQRERHLASLFVSHDMSVVRHVTDRVTILYRGAVMEDGPTERVFTEPAHPYTKALLSAVPRTHPAQPGVIGRGGAIVDDATSTVDGGCPFRGRCPHAWELCAQERPERTPVAGGGHAACHLISA